MIIEKSPFYNKKLNLNSENSDKLITKNHLLKNQKKIDFHFGVGLKV